MEKIVFFGGGKVADKVQNLLKKDVVAIIDNKQTGYSNRGIPYITLDEYKAKFSNLKIYITSSKYAQEMISQLEERGISNYVIPIELYIDELVPFDNDIAHGNWPNYLKTMFDYEGKEILEVGSRHVVDDFRHYFTEANYTGFDIYPGENVDVVGDAHKLSTYFNKKFDLIYSSAVFEHLAMPWIVSTEIIKLLKPGGYVFIETHYSYSSHERPWHFFQFSENAINILFPRVFGIECVKKGCSNLIEGKFSEKSSEYLKGRLVTGLYCHSEFLGRKVNEVELFDWSKVDINELVYGTEYPRK